MEENPKAPSASPTEENQNECKICFEAKNGVFAFLPCYHAPACEQCCRRIVQSSESTCPICRSQVTDFKKIFLWRLLIEIINYKNT